MTGPSLLDRLKGSRLVQVLILYLGASWVVIEVSGDLQDSLRLPAWLTPVSKVLLLVGLVVVLATAWVQSNPRTDAREAAGEVPDPWEVGLGDFLGDIRRGRFPHLTWGRAILGGVFALALLFGFAGGYVLLTDGAPATPAPNAGDEAVAGLAIVPFSVSGVDEEVYREGMITLRATWKQDACGRWRGRTLLCRSTWLRWKAPHPRSWSDSCGRSACSTKRRAMKRTPCATFASAQTFPYAALRAARLADRLGDADEARRLYSELLMAWDEADPQFQPWLEEARGWLERVPG